LNDANIIQHLLYEIRITLIRNIIMQWRNCQILRCCKYDSANKNCDRFTLLSSRDWIVILEVNRVLKVATYQETLPETELTFSGNKNSILHCMTFSLTLTFWFVPCYLLNFTVCCSVSLSTTLSHRVSYIYQRIKSN